MISKKKLQEMFAGVNLDINDRWEKGVGHHPKALEMAEILEAVDWHFQNDSLCLKFGGDGDNGEALLYLLDIYFEGLDLKEVKKQNNT